MEEEKEKKKQKLDIDGVNTWLQAQDIVLLRTAIEQLENCMINDLWFEIENETARVLFRYILGLEKKIFYSD